MSRGFIDERTNSLIAAFRYPGRIGFLGRMDLATGKLTHLTDLNGMMLYKVTSVAFDPASRTAFYTDENYAYRDLNAIDVDTGKKRRLLTDARIGDLAFNRADNSLWGIRHQNGLDLAASSARWATGRRPRRCGWGRGCRPRPSPARRCRPRPDRR